MVVFWLNLLKKYNVIGKILDGMCLGLDLVGWRGLLFISFMFVDKLFVYILDFLYVI